MRRVVFNQKGGVGKSSIVANLAAISAAKGLKTLVIDLDPQCNSSHYLTGNQFSEFESDISDFFKQLLSFKLRAQPIEELVYETTYENLYIIPSSPALGEIQAQLESKHKIYKFREALIALDRIYDVIYVDTPPAFNFFTLSALIAAERCLIPFDCDEFSRQALYTLMDNVEETRNDHNAALMVEGIIVNQYQPRASFPQRIVEELIAEGLPLLQPYLSSSVKMRESHDAGVPLIHFVPKHKLTAEFEALFSTLHPRYGSIQNNIEVGAKESTTAELA